MSEHGIDKYFREHLKGVEEPILPEDWKTFEKMAVSNRSSKWLYLLLLLPLLGVSAYIFYPNSDERTNKPKTSEIISNTNNQQQKEENTSKQTESTSTKPSVIESTTELNSDFDQYASSKNNEAESNETRLSESVEEKNLNDNYESFGKQGEQVASTKSNDLTKNSTSDKSGIKQETAVTVEATTKPVGVTFDNSGEVATAGLSSISSENTTPDTDAKNKNTRATDTGFIMESNYEPLPIIGLSEIDKSNVPQLNTDIETATNPEIKTWSIDAFVQYEQNNELGGIPSAGFISSWQKNKWNIGLGLGIGQTGTLNWLQTREDISYGFDVYDENYQLKTKNFTFLSMPIHLAYQVFPRSEFFLTLTPEMIINASQAYGPSESNQNQSSGYLYKTGAPSMLIFIGAGYSYSLTDFLKLDLGINYSPQKWDVTENNPLGGFIRIKYNIK